MALTYDVKKELIRLLDFIRRPFEVAIQQTQSENDLERILTMKTVENNVEELLQWDIERPGQCSMAANRFMELYAIGFRPFAVNPDKSKGAALDEFDMDAGLMWMVMDKAALDARLAAKMPPKKIGWVTTKETSPTGWKRSTYYNPSTQYFVPANLVMPIEYDPSEPGLEYKADTISDDQLRRATQTDVDEMLRIQKEDWLKPIHANYDGAAADRAAEEAKAFQRDYAIARQQIDEGLNEQNLKAKAEVERLRSERNRLIAKKKGRE